MTEPKFTPGPLETDFYNVKGHNVYWVKDSLNRAVCECFIQYPFAGKPGITGDEAEANAFLYAAAPEMYDALMETVYLRCFECMGGLRHNIDMTREELVKNGCPKQNKSNVCIYVKHLELLRKARDGK